MLPRDALSVADYQDTASVLIIAPLVPRRHRPTGRYERWEGRQQCATKQLRGRDSGLIAWHAFESRVPRIRMILQEMGEALFRPGDFISRVVAIFFVSLMRLDGSK